MSIDGKNLADTLLETLKTRTSLLKSKGITPTLAVILVGDDPGSASYVRQKEKTAERIGAELRVMRYGLGVTKDAIQKQIKELNADRSIHGIIIQRPLPKQLQDEKLLGSISPSKDVDGFVPGSKFKVPVAIAVERILKQIFNFQFSIFKQTEKKLNFKHWINMKNTIVIGRGETAGKPIAEYFSRLGCHVSVVHSQTTKKEKQRQIQSADIIISCVGKKQVIQGATLNNIEGGEAPNSIKQGATLISVGIWRDSEGKLHGDYEEKDIKDTAAFYTPTPGGVGPVNVACLIENLLTACTSHPLSVH